MSAQPIPKYETYKSSGTFWLGEIPANWSSCQLKYITTLSTVKVMPTMAVKYVGMENIHSNDGRFIETGEQEPEGLSLSFSHGDVLFGKLRPYLAKSWMASFSGICSSEFLVLRARDVSPRFLNYVTLSREFISIVDSSTYGAKMPRASWDFIGMLKVPVPEHCTSIQIAKFLDYETGKIDALIEKQQRLIALLKEKRQAVISHAVTKGLNPAAPMRDSGIEWLGQVPAHWQVKQFKHLLATIVDNRGRTPPFGGEGVPMLEAKQITEGTRYPSRTFTKFVAQEIVEQFERDTVQEGDVLITTVGATAGRAVLVDADPDFFIAQNVIGMRPNTDVIPDFLFYLVTSDFFYDSLFMMNKSNTIDNLKVSVFIHNTVVLPPMNEQAAIIKRLNSQIESFARLDVKTHQAIELLQERRTALISAAVTGKIDVRGWQPPQPKPATEAT